MQSLDEFLFYFVNRELTCNLFDILMPYITDLSQFWWFYTAIFGYMLVKDPRKGIASIALVLIAVGIGDFLNSYYLKEVVNRIRPCSALSDVRLLVPCGAGKSFPSTHAVNNAIFASLCFYSHRKVSYIAMPIALLVAYSRIYIGVHYPFDIISGAAVGIVLAFLCIVVYENAQKKFPEYFPKIQHSSLMLKRSE